MLDADVVMGPLRHELIFDLDGREAGRLTHADGAVHVHGIAEPARAVENQRQRGDGADLDGHLTHLGQVEIGLEATFW